MDAAEPSGDATYPWTLKKLRSGIYDLWVNVPMETLYDGHPAVPNRVKHRSVQGRPQLTIESSDGTSCPPRSP